MPISNAMDNWVDFTPYRSNQKEETPEERWGVEWIAKVIADIISHADFDHSIAPIEKTGKVKAGFILQPCRCRLALFQLDS